MRRSAKNNWEGTENEEGDVFVALRPLWIIADQLSKLAQEVHQARIVAPPSPDSEVSPWIAGGQRLCFRSQIRFCIDVGGVKRHVAQPRPDRVEINARTKQVSSRCVANRMRTNSLGPKRWNLLRRSISMTGHERMNPKARHGFAISVEKQRTTGIATPDKGLEFRYCLLPERAKANLLTFTLDLHSETRTNSMRAIDGL